MWNARPAIGVLFVEVLSVLSIDPYLGFLPAKGVLERKPDSPSIDNSLNTLSTERDADTHCFVARTRPRSNVAIIQRFAECFTA